MTKELIEFIENYDKQKPLSLNEILNFLKRLPESEHKIFLEFVNLKNGEDFLKKIKNGEV